MALASFCRSSPAWTEVVDKPGPSQLAVEVVLLVMAPLGPHSTRKTRTAHDSFACVGEAAATCPRFMPGLWQIPPATANKKAATLPKEAVAAHLLQDEIARRQDKYAASLDDGTLAVRLQAAANPTTNSSLLRSASQANHRRCPIASVDKGRTRLAQRVTGTINAPERLRSQAFFGRPKEQDLWLDDSF